MSIPAPLAPQHAPVNDPFGTRGQVLSCRGAITEHRRQHMHPQQGDLR